MVLEEESLGLFCCLFLTGESEDEGEGDEDEVDGGPNIQLSGSCCERVI